MTCLVQDVEENTNMAKLKGFPARFKGAKADECEGEGWLAHFMDARSLLLKGGIAVFVGDCGVGKTRMAYELSKLHPERSLWISGMTRELPAIYTTGDSMMDSIKQNFSSEKDAPSSKTAIEEFTSASLLVIDELDQSITTEFAQLKLKRIIDERYMAKLPTILITNYKPNKLSRLLPKPVISRVVECGKGFYFNWPSFRTPQKA